MVSLLAKKGCLPLSKDWVYLGLIPSICCTLGHKGEKDEKETVSRPPLWSSTPTLYQSLEKEGKEY